MKTVEVTIITHKQVPDDNYDLVTYEKKLREAYANMMQDPNIKVHVKG